MRVSIGFRLFYAVLLAIIAVGGVSLALLRDKLVASFTTYATQIELDRLQGLAGELQARYATHGGWGFLPADSAARAQWIATELARLSGESVAAAEGTVPAAPARPRIEIRQQRDGTTALPVPPLPPLPPVPPQPEVPGLGRTVRGPSLQQRVMLTDAAHRYLAGRHIDPATAMERPVVVDGRTVGHLAVARSSTPTDASADAFFDELGRSLAVIVAISIALSGVAAILLAVHFRRPILRLVTGARALATGRLETRIALGRSDELGELADSFNHLAAQLEQQEGVRRQWMADTSHELRTPLAVLRAQLEALQDGVRTAEPRHVAAMLQQVALLGKLVDDLAQLSRFDAGRGDLQRQAVDAGVLVRELADAFAERARAAQLQLEVDMADGPLSLQADPDRLRQLVGNLLENAVRYTAPGGRIVVAATADAGACRLTIEDSAPSVPDAALARLGERWYRPEASRSRAHGGSGLGLALCRAIVAAHGGTLRFSRSSLGGLRVEVTLPRETAA